MMASECSIRRGTPEDFLAVKRLLDAAVLETDDDRLRRQLVGEDGCVQIATTAETAVGVVAVETSVGSEIPLETEVDHEPVHITAIAVRKSRQNRGIGRQLLEAVAEEISPRPLTAEFSADLKPFYRGCGFEIEAGENRLWGIRRPASE